MKRFLALILALMMLLAFTACGSGSEEKKDESAGDWPENVTIATGTTGGTIYYIGAAQTQILNDAIEGVNFAAEATDSTPTMNGPIVQNDPIVWASSQWWPFKRL